MAELNNPRKAPNDGKIKMPSVQAGMNKRGPMMGKGDKAPQKPWEAAEGLEWEVPSPAPFHTFETPPKLNASATKIIA